MAHLNIFQDKQTLWRWRLVDSNGRIIADSAESYVTKDNAKRGAENVIEEVKKLDKLSIQTTDGGN